jgi:hypothetical protein
MIKHNFYQMGDGRGDVTKFLQSPGTVYYLSYLCKGKDNKPNVALWCYQSTGSARKLFFKGYGNYLQHNSGN